MAPEIRLLLPIMPLQTPTIGLLQKIIPMLVLAMGFLWAIMHLLVPVNALLLVIMLMLGSANALLYKIIELSAPTYYKKTATQNCVAVVSTNKIYCCSPVVSTINSSVISSPLSET